MSDMAITFDRSEVPRDERLRSAAEMLDMLADFYADDGYTFEQWLELCGEAWPEDDDSAARDTLAGTSGDD